MFKMRTFWWIAAVLVNSGIGHAQEEFVTNTPLEFDSNINIWEEIEYDPVRGSQQSLISLCEQYDLAINGNKINCAKIKLSPKLENQEEHILRKRETDEEPLEGSGTGALDENIPSEQPEFITKLEIQEPIGDEKRNPENVEAAFSGDEKEIQRSGKIDDGEELTLYNQTVDTLKESTEEVSSKPEEGKLNITKDLTTPNYTDRSPNPETEQSYMKIEESLSNSESVEENAQTNPQNSAVTKIQEKEGQDQTSTTVDEEYKKKITPPSILPSDLAEVEENEKERLDEKQSGNAVINFKIKENSGIEGADSDKTISKMDQNESLKSMRSSEPNAEESSKNIQKASKDTNILIILFAAVVVIGIAAFGYNRFQKRRQNNTDSSGETGNIQKNLQNMTNGKSDHEQGTEMKPLIKNAEKTIIKEYTDKENDKVEAINEKH